VIFFDAEKLLSVQCKVLDLRQHGRKSASQMLSATKKQLRPQQIKLRLFVPPKPCIPPRQINDVLSILIHRKILCAFPISTNGVSIQHQQIHTLSNRCHALASHSPL
jgi:hypothetical protein